MSGGNAGAAAPLPSLLPIGSGITRSFITWEEIAEGLERAAEVDRILQQVRLTLIPKQVAWETSRIQRELAAIGRRLSENDASLDRHR